MKKKSWEAESGMFQEDRAEELLFIQIQIKKKLLQLSLHIDKNRREILPERSRAHVHIKKKHLSTGNNEY